MEIFKDFTFEAAHFSPKVAAGHKCGKMHGHSYKIRLHVTGTVNPDTGWLVDFESIKTVFNPILTQLDHSLLNDINGLSNPTTENLAIWIWSQLKPQLPQLSKITIQETATSGCIYEGN